MVTKLYANSSDRLLGYILAKNHMVTKRIVQTSQISEGYILAKNHMVTKQHFFLIFGPMSRKSTN